MHEKFFIEIVKNTIDYREKNNIVRKDFMQFLIETRNNERLNNISGQQPISIETCAAQIFIFYIAGFETTSSAISYTIYELARQPKILDKLQQEIRVTLDKHDNKLTYEAIQEMKYLDLCIMG